MGWRRMCGNEALKHLNGRHISDLKLLHQCVCYLNEIMVFLRHLLLDFDEVGEKEKVQERQAFCYLQPQAQATLPSRAARIGACLYSSC